MVFTNIEKTLFFKDTACGAKYKPQTHKNPTSFGEAIANVGTGLGNMIFFDDLKTVHSQDDTVASSSSSSDEGSNDGPVQRSSSRSKRSSKNKRFTATMPTIHDDEAQFLAAGFKSYEDIDDMTLPFNDENTVQIKCRRQTIPPPALKRFKKQELARFYSSY